MTNDHRFSGRVAFVTGAASGIGAATATRLLAEGAKVATFDLAAGASRRSPRADGRRRPFRRRRGGRRRGHRVARPDRRARLLRRHPRRLAPHRRTSRRRVESRHGDQRRRRVLVQPGCRPGDGRARVRQDRQRRLDRGQGGQPDGGRLLGVEGGGDRPHEGGRQGLRRDGRLRQLHRTGGDRDPDPRTVSRSSTSTT